MIEEMVKAYDHLSKIADYEYLLSVLPEKNLQILDSIIEAYSTDKIDIIFPLEMYYDGDLLLVIKDEDYEEIGVEIDVVKWLEGLVDTDYLVEVMQMTI